MIQVTGLAKSFGTQTLFENMTFTLGRGEKVGLVGRNGSGKTTLLKILLGDELPDAGAVTFPARYRIATLKQHLQFTHPTIIEEASSALPEEQKFDTFRAEKILMGLGFTIHDFTRAPSEFSGGMQIRLNLAKVLIQDPDCLFLDEPTNYLDLLGMRWLAGFLKNFKGELVLITHDSGFMNQVVTHTMGIWRQKLVKTPGGPDKFYAQIEQDEEVYEKTRMNQEKKRREMEEFVERFKAKASKATQAQSRMKMLNKMDRLDALEETAELDFHFSFQECPGKVLLEVKNLGFSWDGQDPLFKHLSFPVYRNDKIAVIGKNGKGKSTLLNILSGDLVQKEGSLQTHPSILVGHFGQTNIKRLHDGHTIEEEIASVNPELPVQRVRNICGTMMFPGDLAKKKISVLSGGEKARVLLGKLLAKPTNLLLLDEPSNHLDQVSVEALQEEIQNYPGAVVVVAHSESFVRATAQKLVIFHHDRADYFLGTYDEFLAKEGWGDEEASQPHAPTKPKRDRAEVLRLRAEIFQERSKLLTPIKKKIEKLEQTIDADEKTAAHIENEMIQKPETSASKARELGLLRKKIDQDFEDLTNLSLQHDEAFRAFEEKIKALE